METPISELLANPTVVGTIRVEDDDRTEENKMIMYSSENNLFSVESATGHVYFSPFKISGDDLEVSTTVTADDGGDNPATLLLTVTIENTDNSQDVGILEQTLSIREGELEVPTIVVATGTEVRYSVTDASFRIEENTGILSFVSSPDYEDVNQREYTLLVTVMNELSDASAMVTVRVEDVNDNKPTMLRLVDDMGLEISNVEVEEGGVGVLGTLKADDVDTVGDLVYTMEKRYEVYVRRDRR